jgi:hypothetical protein
MAGTLSSERAALIGSIGGNITASRTDSLERTARARQAAYQRFLDEVDPRQELPEDERHRRAKALERAHMARMRLLSADARAERKERCDAVAA